MNVKISMAEIESSTQYLQHQKRKQGAYSVSELADRFCRHPGHMRRIIRQMIADKKAKHITEERRTNMSGSSTWIPLYKVDLVELKRRLQMGKDGKAW